MQHHGKQREGRCHLTCLGPTAWDTIAVADRLTGDPVPVTGRVVITPGGRAANMAVAGARLGATAALVSCVGNDLEGYTLTGRLRAYGVNLDRLVMVPGRTDRVSIQSSPVSGQRAVVDIDAGRCLDGEKAQSAVSDITDTDAIILSGSLGWPVLETAIRAARDANALVVVNPAPSDGPIVEAIESADVVTVNASEAQRITGVRAYDRPSARRAATDLLSRGPRLVAVTAGSAGDLFEWRTGELWCPPNPSIKVLDTTGGGDAMTAALTVKLCEGADPAAAGAFAALAGGLAMRRLGAQASLPNRPEVEDLMEEAALRGG